MNQRIDYYTGTGGSEIAAKQIFAELNTKGCSVDVNRIVRDKFIASDDFDYYVLLYIRSMLRGLCLNGCKS